MSAKKPEGLSIQKAINALRELDPDLVPLLDAFQIEDSGGAKQMVLAKDEGNAGNTKFRICLECNNRTLKTENGCDVCMDPDCGYSKCDK